MSTRNSSTTVSVESSESLSMVNDTFRAQLGVFRNPDLLELIFEHFGVEEGLLSPYYQGPVGQVTKRNLLWACLTARSFAIPALTILWRHMKSIWPLILVLPNLRLENGSYKLVGSIEGADLQRVLFYSRRIRVLHIEGEPTYTKVAWSLLEEVCDKIQELEPLSSLQQLFVWFDRLDSKQLILLSLISLSNVNTLHLKTFLPITAPTTSSFLQSDRFKSQLKNIRQLKITGDFSAFDPRLPDFTNLQHLHLSDVSSSVSACFLKGCASSMPFLQSLRLRLFSEVEDHHVYGHDPVRFEMLSRLDLGGFPKAIGCIMDVIHIPLVDNLILCMLHGGHLDVSNAISKFIHHNRKTAKQTIRAITIAFESNKLQDFDLSPDDFNAFEGLEVFYFNASSLQITGRQLSKFLGEGDDWFKIRELSLLYDFSDNPEQTLAIASLAIIADRCPNLHTLRISIYNPDQSEMRDGVNPRSLRTPHHLSELELRGLPRAWDYSESFAITLASFLHYIFPRLNVVGCRGSIWPGELDDWWEMIRENMVVFQEKAREAHDFIDAELVEN